MFNEAETTFLINAIDRDIKANGLQTAQLALAVTFKLQNAFRLQKEAAQTPTAVPSTLQPILEGKGKLNHSKSDARANKG